MAAITRSGSAVSPYETEDVLQRWLRVYDTQKERAFVAYLDRFIPRDKVSLLDMGCGIGLHAALWSERHKQVTAADLSTRFRDYILRTYGFPFIWTDVLNSTIQGGYDICFSMAIATILLDEERRFQTFKTLAGLLHPGSILLLVTGSNQWPFYRSQRSRQLHCLDQRDFQKLRELRLEVAHVLHWSSTPKWLWCVPGLKHALPLVEGLGARLGLGARRIAICRRT